MSKKENVTPQTGTVRVTCLYLFHNWLVLQYNNDVGSDVDLDVIRILICDIKLGTWCSKGSARTFFVGGRRRVRMNLIARLRGLSTA